MPCSDDTCADDDQTGEDVDELARPMCVPINMRFFDSTNTREITQVVGGESFVARVTVDSIKGSCSTLQINLTFPAATIPDPTNPTNPPLSVDAPIVSQTPPNPLSQFTSSSDGPYASATVVTKVVLNDTSVTVRGAKDGAPNQFMQNIIKVTRS